jgi:hypothetical protein
MAYAQSVVIAAACATCAFISAGEAGAAAATAARAAVETQATVPKRRAMSASRCSFCSCSYTSPPAWQSPPPTHMMPRRGSS